VELDPYLESIMEDLREKSKSPDRRAEHKRREKEQKAATVAALIEQSGIPKRYMREDFDSFVVTTENRQALSACRNYVKCWPDQKDVEGLALFGDIGVGKTHLAISVMKELITRYMIPAKYANVLHTFERAKWSFDSDRVNPIPRLLNCPFLVLDDLGSERPTSWTLSQVMLIVDYRLGEELPMLITSNAATRSGLMSMLTLEVRGDVESRAHLAIPVQRAIDRLREIVGDPIIIKGKSWRGRRKHSLREPEGGEK